MAKISSVVAHQILDSRGNPTIETEIVLEDTSTGKASIPSGASTGTYEAVELRDGGDDYDGKGVSKAIENVNTVIAEKIIGREFDQNSLDKILIDLDGTKNKSRLGANSILSVSLAFARANANSQSKELYQYFGDLIGNSSYSMPTPMFNILNGGKHAKGSTDVQEFMIVPIDKSIEQSLSIGQNVFDSLGELLRQNGYDTNLGDEGGFAPILKSNIEAIEFIEKAISKSNLSPGKDVGIGLDVAASELFENGKYFFSKENKSLDADELTRLYTDWLRDFPIVSIEDGLDEEDWAGFAKLNSSIPAGVFNIGDDLLVTNKSRLEKAIQEKSINAIIIKLNQVGTVSETIETIKLAQENNIEAIISHRSGETMDDYIADLAVGVGAKFIKSGALSKPERRSKYDRLIAIYKNLGQ